MPAEEQSNKLMRVEAALGGTAAGAAITTAKQAAAVQVPQEVPQLPDQTFMLENFGCVIQGCAIFRKKGFVCARLAVAGEQVDTVIKDTVETSNTAKEGDFVVRNPAHGELMILTKEKFKERYEGEAPLSEVGLSLEVKTELEEKGFHAYQAKGKIWALELSEALRKEKLPEGRFIPAWGGEMQVDARDYLAMPFPKGNEVYRIEREAFFETYQPEAAEAAPVEKCAPQ